MNKFILLIMLSLTLTGCRSPKYKVGECAVYTTGDTERWEEKSYIIQIIEVGKNKYRLRSDTYNKNFYNFNSKFYNIDNNSEKVDCPKAYLETKYE